VSGPSLPVLQQWRREGECSRCGDCCVGDPFDGARGEPHFPGMCPELVPGPDATRVCRVHGSKGDDVASRYWRMACALWPTKPIHVARERLQRCTISVVAAKD